MGKFRIIFLLFLTFVFSDSCLCAKTNRPKSRDQKQEQGQKIKKEEKGFKARYQEWIKEVPKDKKVTVFEEIKAAAKALAWKKPKKKAQGESKSVKNKGLAADTRKMKKKEKKKAKKAVKELEQESRKRIKEFEQKKRERDKVLKLETEKAIEDEIRKIYGASTLEEIDDQIKLRQQSLKTLKVNKKGNRKRIERMQLSIESLKILKKDASESKNTESHKFKIRDEKREEENEKLEEEKEKLKDKTILNKLYERKFKTATQKWVDSLSPEEAVKKYEEFGNAAKIYEDRQEFLYARKEGRISSWGADETRFEVKALRKKIDDQKQLRKNSVKGFEEQSKDVQKVIDLEKDSLNSSKENLKKINKQIEELTAKGEKSPEEKEQSLKDLKDWLISKQFMEGEIKKYQSNIKKEEDSLKELEGQRRIFNLESEEFRKELDEVRDKSIVLEREILFVQRNLKKINEEENLKEYKREEEKLSGMKKELEENESKRKLYEKRGEADI